MNQLKITNNIRLHFTKIPSVAQCPTALVSLKFEQHEALVYNAC